MREGKDDVMMRTGQQSLFPAVEPLCFGKPSSLRAAAVPTGVVGNLTEVVVGATVDMPPELTSAAVLNRPCRPVHVRRYLKLGLSIKLRLIRPRNTTGWL